MPINGLLKLLKTLQETKGIRFEPSASYTQAQNGGAESSGGVVKEKARAMRSFAKLPHDLWHEIVKSAVYLLNRTPKYNLQWKTPLDRFHTALKLKWE